MKQTANYAYVGLGSNLPSIFGSPKKTILHAMETLSRLSEQQTIKSSLWQSQPVDCPAGSPLFINAIVSLIPLLYETPMSLLEKLQAIEIEYGRKKSLQKNQARCLDLDLIMFGGAQCQTQQLILPHPRAHVRSFVLCPLAEVAKELRLPGQTMSVTELLACVSEPCEKLR